MPAQVMHPAAFHDSHVMQHSYSAQQHLGGISYDELGA